MVSFPGRSQLTFFSEDDAITMVKESPEPKKQPQRHVRSLTASPKEHQDKKERSKKTCRNTAAKALNEGEFDAREGPP
jgi:hypothetical protein